MMEVSQSDIMSVRWTDGRSDTDVKITSYTGLATARS